MVVDTNIISINYKQYQIGNGILKFPTEIFSFTWKSVLMFGILLVSLGNLNTVKEITVGGFFLSKKKRNFLQWDVFTAHLDDHMTDL